MKVTMYMDIPKYHAEGNHYFATSKPLGSVSAPFRRVAFQVEIPIGAYDELLPPVQSFEVPKEGEG